MRTIIAGSRTVTDPHHVTKAMVLARTFSIVPTVVISGAAPGVDRLGEKWAESHGLPVERYPADWLNYGRSAGPTRNREMAAVADALVAVWDGASRGTANMIEVAKARGLRTYVYLVPLEVE